MYASFVFERQENRGHRRYMVLLILTDGNVSDLEATRRKIRAVSQTPISIIIVGIGDADFSAMRNLQNPSDAEGSERLIVTFIRFKEHQHNPNSFARAALEMVPNQLAEYFGLTGQRDNGIRKRANCPLMTANSTLSDISDENA